MDTSQMFFCALWEKKWISFSLIEEEKHASFGLLY